MHLKYKKIYLFSINLIITKTSYEKISIPLIASIKFFGVNSKTVIALEKEGK
jgi:hypothetical protein